MLGALLRPTGASSPSTASTSPSSPSATAGAARPPPRLHLPGLQPAARRSPPARTSSSPQPRRHPRRAPPHGAPPSLLEQFGLGDASTSARAALRRREAARRDRPRARQRPDLILADEPTANLDSSTVTTRAPPPRFAKDDGRSSSSSATTTASARSPTGSSGSRTAPSELTGVVTDPVCGMAVDAAGTDRRRRRRDLLVLLAPCRDEFLSRHAAAHASPVDTRAE